MWVSVGACGCVLLFACLFCLALFGLSFVSVLLFLFCADFCVGLLFFVLVLFNFALVVCVCM